MKAFNSITEEQQNTLRQRYVIPTDTSKIFLNRDNIPCEKIGNALVSCTLKKVHDNFHNYSNKQTL